MTTEPQKILVIHGPNFNMLGKREPEVYGHETLKDLEALCANAAQSCGLVAVCRQSNHEGDMIEWIHEAMTDFAGIIINAGAYTHTSLAIADALRMVSVPIIEVHISNVFKREAFRQHSYISPVAAGMICGLGTDGYGLAMQALAKRIQRA